MELFKTESGLVYHTYMYEGTRVVFFMDVDDAEKLGLNIIKTDEFAHAAVSYDEVKNLPIETWKGMVYWPQCNGGEGDDCEIIRENVSAEDASTDEKLFKSVL